MGFLEEILKRTPLYNSSAPILPFALFPVQPRARGTKNTESTNTLGYETRQPSISLNNNSFNMAFRTNPSTARQNIVNTMANSPQGRATLAPDRVSAFGTYPQYAVTRNLTAADRTVPFQNARSSQDTTSKTVPIVLKYLAKEGVQINPEVSKVFSETADQMLRQWYQAVSQEEMQVDITEYYQAMTDMVMELQRQYDSGVMSSGQQTTQTPNVTQAAFQTGTSNPPQTGLPRYDLSELVTTDEARLTPTADMMTWNGGYWGTNQTGFFASKAVYEAYTGWLQGTAQPTWDKTPEGYLRYILLTNPNLGGM